MGEKRPRGVSVVVLWFPAYVLANVLSYYAYNFFYRTPLIDVASAAACVPGGILLGRWCREGAEKEARWAGVVVVLAVYVQLGHTFGLGAQFNTFIWQHSTETAWLPLQLTLGVAVPVLLGMAANALGVEMGARWRRAATQSEP